MDLVFAVETKMLPSSFDQGSKTAYHTRQTAYRLTGINQVSLKRTSRFDQDQPTLAPTDVNLQKSTGGDQANEQAYQTRGRPRLQEGSVVSRFQTKMLPSSPLIRGAKSY